MHVKKLTLISYEIISAWFTNDLQSCTLAHKYHYEQWLSQQWSNGSDSPHHCQAWIVQLYLPGGCQVHSCLILVHGSTT